MRKSYLVSLNYQSMTHTYLLNDSVMNVMMSMTHDATTCDDAMTMCWEHETESKQRNETIESIIKTRAVSEGNVKAMT